jgi:DNA modification methylase
LTSTEYAGQKPVALIKEIMDVFSAPGEVVLDCFAGMGTTLAASIALHRVGLAIEIKESTIGKALESLIYRVSKKDAKSKVRKELSDEELAEAVMEEGE